VLASACAALGKHLTQSPSTPTWQCGLGASDEGQSADTGVFTINIVLFPPDHLLPKKKVGSLPGSTRHVWGVLPTPEHKKSALT